MQTKQCIMLSYSLKYRNYL